MKRMISAVLVCLATFGASARLTSAQEAAEDRPATPTFWGDRGLWFVPTAEVPKSGEWSFSFYRSDLARNEGFTNISFLPVTGSVGVGNRLEVFGSMRLSNRIDRDVRPLFFSPPPPGGGVLNDYPFVREPFTNEIGDLRLGAKLNVVSQERGGPMAVALRGTVKLPTADADTGAGTGEFDFFVDGIVSGEINRRVELSGFGGIVLREDPGAFSLADSFRWGVGAAFPTRRSLRVTTELFGELPLDDNVVGGSPLVGTDGSVAPTLSKVESDVYANVGLTWQHRSGLFVGGGLTYRFNTDQRSDLLPIFSDELRDAFGWQFRIGFFPRKRPAPATTARTDPAPAPAPRPAPVPAPPPAPAPSTNRPPTVSVQCNPCQVVVGQPLTLQATAQDPDGDQLSYRWAVPAGTLANPTAATTQWTAGTAPGTVVATMTVTDGRGGMATGTATLQVVAAIFDDIIFDFDQSTLRPDALNTLQQVLAALRARPTMRLLIEGHASAEGTAEYNLALGARRASAVREYLGGQGIDLTRLTTVSYGEERPRFPNISEANRALNRRASFAIQPQ